MRANLLASGLIVAGWGCFLIQGVRDPLGGINSLWPLFGIANQLLASIALCLATTVILKMSLAPGPGTQSTGSARSSDLSPAERRSPRRSPALALVTLVPCLWLLSATLTAGVEKIFHPDPRIGFLSAAKACAARVAEADPARNPGQSAEALAAARKGLESNRRLYFNYMLDAFVAGAFLVLVALLVAISVREWLLLLARRKLAQLKESEAVWLPDYAAAESRPLAVFSLLTLAFALARELSGEADLDRAQQAAHASACACAAPQHHPVTLTGKPPPPTREQLYVQTLEKRYQGINRCC
jgi:carbon starvation protein